MESEKRWYVIHTYSGYENKVSANLERKVHSLGMENEIFRIVIPMENEVEVKDGKKRSVQRKVFPGYVLVEMIVNDRSWYAVRNTPGVTGFVGSGTKPIPLTDEEVKQIMRSMGVEESRPKIDLQLQQMLVLSTMKMEERLTMKSWNRSWMQSLKWKKLLERNLVTKRIHFLYLFVQEQELLCQV